MEKSNGARPLYSRRPVLNGEEIVEWAKSVGFGATLTPDDLHVTMIYSKTPVLWEEMDWGRETGMHVVKGGVRQLDLLGPDNAAVLKFDDPYLVARWAYARQTGASWEHVSFSPHITLSYGNVPAGIFDIDPYDGDIVLGPEIFEEIIEDFGSRITEKRQVDDDQFTLKVEAVARSFELGFDGAIHVYDRDGQAVFMPGETHEVYLAAKREEATKSADTASLIRTLKNLIGMEEPNKAFPEAGSVLKFDDEQRVVWGWASVISEKGKPVIDLQGDSISPDVLVKAANEFMLDVRVAKSMHEGDSVGEVIHSLPLTDEIAKSLGLSSQREGWIIAMKIHDDEIWEQVKSGDLAAFSIGGKAIRNAA